MNIIISKSEDEKEKTKNVANNNVIERSPNDQNLQYIYYIITPWNRQSFIVSHHYYKV